MRKNCDTNVLYHAPNSRQTPRSVGTAGAYQIRET